ncbi:MAG: FecR domain-containing protein [Bacteroidales bacterium]|jgi:ferric-dicitrate binding protein FerR (iron transport regulator)|nr:FecR domain-containing protein [Bacteroidales bacterium]
MKTSSSYYDDLITRYLSGEASAGEIHTLEHWVKADPANRKVFEEYSKTWSTLGKSRIEYTLNLDMEWNIIQLKISTSKHKDLRFFRPSSFVLRLLRVAALLLLLAIPTFLLFRYFLHPVEKQFSAQNDVVSCKLPDGTAVTLNKGATLVYPSRFNDSPRLVTLKGEAWFEVSPDKTKPFIISAENVRIRVVGTSFLVNTITSNNSKEIILSSGKVKVYFEDRPDKNAVLSPGEKVELITDGYAIHKNINTDVNYLSWKTKHMVFNNTPLPDVVTLLVNVYHTSILIYDDSLKNCRITATFDHQSLESVLNVLKATLDLQVRNSGSGIQISGHGCR